jgi:hypothetical protein
MKLSNLTKRMILTIIIIALICVIGSIIYHRSMDFIPFLLGVVIGSAVSIAKVFLLEHAVDKALTLGKKQAGNYVSLQHILRLLLTGVVLFLGAVIPQISLWGVAAGIFAFRIALYTVKFTSKN